VHCVWECVVEQWLGVHCVWECVVEQWLVVHCVWECVVEQWLGVRRTFITFANYVQHFIQHPAVKVNSIC